MKPVSRKRASRNRQAKKLEAEYAELHPLCQWCLLTNGEPIADSVLCGETIHHMVRGASKPVALLEPCAWLHLCRFHHDWIHVTGVTLEQQLAVKFLSDPEGLDLLRVNELRGRSPTAVTFVDLAPFLQLKAA